MLRTKRAAGGPITTGSLSHGRRHLKGMCTTVPKACASVVTPSTESWKAIGLNVGSDCTEGNFFCLAGKERS